MKRIATALLIAMAACMAASAALAGCATASADDAPRGYEFRDISDYFAPRDPEGAVRVAEEQAEKAAQAEREAAEAAQAAEAEREHQEAYYEPYSGSYGVQGNPDGLNSFDGVYEYGGHLETYYASRAVYDDQLWVDDSGFFRDDQGRYVVASSEYAEGTEVEISQGTAVVMDSGPDAGIVDVHVTWGR